MIIETPRGTMDIHTIFDDEETAMAMGWGSDSSTASI